MDHRVNNFSTMLHICDHHRLLVIFATKLTVAVHSNKSTDITKAVRLELGNFWTEIYLA
jgi:hypothetical protein